MESCPYKGLLPYREKDARYFFGRTRERRVIRDNLCASRLTVLYGASGVGKSSVLGAGVAHDLKDDPDYLVIYFGTAGAWLNDPVTSLNSLLREKLAEPTGFKANGGNGHHKGLFSGLEEDIASTGKTLLLILDQFEEYFQYHPNEEGETTFAEEFPRLLRHGQIPIHFLLSMREDMIAKLDSFKRRIPALLNNRLRIDFLSRQDAIEAVLKPLEVFSQEGQLPGPMAMSEGVAEHVVDRIMAVQKGERERVQTPYLQLVLERWWNRETENGSHEMREDTLRDIGGVETIVDRHLELTLKQLGQGAEDLAASIFQFMVTPGGRKIAQTASDLAASVAGQCPGSDVKDLLGKLRDARVLTTLPPPRDSAPGEQCYEFAHDVMARAALDWRKHYLQVLETAFAKREAEAAKKRELAAEQQAGMLRRLAMSLGAMLLLLLVAGAAAGYYSWLANKEKKIAKENEKVAKDGQLQAYHAQQKAEVASLDASDQRLRADAGELLRAANSNLDSDPELSILLATRADALLREHEQFTPALLGTLLDSLNRSVQTSLIRKTIHLNRPDDMFDIALSPDRRILATYGDNGVVKVWDTLSGRLLHKLQELNDNEVISSVSFSLDAKWLATADWGGHVKVWEISSETKKWQLPNPSEGEKRIVSVAFEPNGKSLATGAASGEVTLWDGNSGKPQILGRHSASVGVVLFSRDGAGLASSGEDKVVNIWDTQSGQLVHTLSGHTAAVIAMAFSDDGKYLATGGSDTTVRLWDMSSGRELRSLRRGGNYIFSLAFDPAGTRIAVGSMDGMATVWDVNSGRELFNLAGHKGPIQAIAFSSDGNGVFTGSWDKTVKVWDVPLVRPEAVSDVAFSPRGDALASASWDSTLMLSDPGGRLAKRVLTPEQDARSRLFSVAFTREGRFLAASDDDKRVRIWDTSSGRQWTAWNVSAPSGLSFSPDGRKVAVGGADNTAEVRDAKTGNTLLVLSGHKDRINQVTFSPNGKLLASASQDWSAQVWDSSSGDSKFVLPMDPSGKKGHKGRLVWVAFSPDSRRLATAAEDHIAKIWDFASGKVLNLLGHTNVVEEVAFSRDGNYVATAGVDGTARVWDAQTGAEVYRFIHSRGVEAVAFSPDGKRLATGSDDGRLRVFLLDREELVRLANTRVTRSWTEDECREYLHESCPGDLAARP